MSHGNKINILQSREIKIDNLIAKIFPRLLRKFNILNNTLSLIFFNFYCLLIALKPHALELDQMLLERLVIVSLLGWAIFFVNEMRPYITCKLE